METVAEYVEQRSQNSFKYLAWRRFKKHRLALFSLCILAFLACLSLGAFLIENLLGVSHTVASLDMANLEPAYPHLLGTNELGQDVFLRLIFGGQISLSVGFLSALASALIGTLIGLLAGYFGGYIDSILMRFTDAMLCVPVLPLMIVFAALDLNLIFKTSLNISFLAILFLIFLSGYLLLRFLSDRTQKSKSSGYFISLFKDALLVTVILLVLYSIVFRLIPWQSFSSGNFASVTKLIFIIVFFGWMSVARLARASALQLKNMEFVTAAQALGASHKRIILSHIFPNALAPIIVAATLEVGSNILYEAALSFLGLGIQPPVSSWGNMLNNAVSYIKSNPSLAFWPGLFILVTVACFNFFGDGLRDALDPHQVMKSAENK
jgi:peptide/nickel transport system permease protein